MKKNKKLILSLLFAGLFGTNVWGMKNLSINDFKTDPVVDKSGTFKLLNGSGNKCTSTSAYRKYFYSRQGYQKSKSTVSKRDSFWFFLYKFHKIDKDFIMTPGFQLVIRPGQEKTSKLNYSIKWNIELMPEKKIKKIKNHHTKKTYKIMKNETTEDNEKYPYTLEIRDKTYTISKHKEHPIFRLTIDEILPEAVISTSKSSSKKTTTGFVVGKKQKEKFAKKSPEVKKTKTFYDDLRKKIFVKYGKNSVKKITVRNKKFELEEIDLDDFDDMDDIQIGFLNALTTILVVEMKNGNKIAGASCYDEKRLIHKDGSISSKITISSANGIDYTPYCEKIKNEGIDILEDKGLLEEEYDTEIKLNDDFVKRYKKDNTLVSEKRQIL